MDICLRITSSENEELCKNDFENGFKNWSGGEIILNYNNIPVATLQNGFNDFHYCFQSDQDEFQKAFIRLQSTSDDEVCITGLFLNDHQILVGKNNDKKSFWLHQNQTSCSDVYMITDQLTIRNGTVTSSSCKGDHRDFPFVWY